MTARRLLAAFGLVAALGGGAAACSSSPSGGATGGPRPAAVVVLKMIEYSPAIVHIRAGQSVEWEWQDGAINHTVTFNTGGVSIGPKSSGAYTRTFPTAGVYKYHCTLHPFMIGEVDVSG